MEQNEAQHIVSLSPWEIGELARIAAGNFLTYAGHDANGGLFPREKEDMKRWGALADKLSGRPPKATS